MNTNTDIIWNKIKHLHTNTRIWNDYIKSKENTKKKQYEFGRVHSQRTSICEITLALLSAPFVDFRKRRKRS